jgi:hypothetical protein
MRSAKTINSAIVTAVIGAVAFFFLTVAMSSLTVPSAQATPAIAKGKPCSTCHAGSPPSKANLKKKKKKKK